MKNIEITHYRKDASILATYQILDIKEEITVEDGKQVLLKFFQMRPNRWLYIKSITNTLKQKGYMVHSTKVRAILLSMPEISIQNTDKTKTSGRIYRYGYFTKPND